MKKRNAAALCMAVVLGITGCTSVVSTEGDTKSTTESVAKDTSAKETSENRAGV